MLTLIIIWILAFLALGGFMGYRVAKLRKASGNSMMETVAPISHHEIHNRALKFVNKQVRLATLEALKYTVKGTVIVKKQFDKGVEKIHDVAIRHERNLEKGAKPSTNFLHSISEYKDKLKHLRDSEEKK